MQTARALQAFFALALLSGCATSPVTAPALPATSATAQRHVLDLYRTDENQQVSSNPLDASAGGAEIWGVNFVQDSYAWAQYRQNVVNGGGREDYQYVDVTTHNLTYTSTGAGDFEYVGNARLMYTVPAGRVLVIDQLVGTTLVDGLALTGTGACNYLFGAGETIVFAPTAGCTLAGYTADPAFLGGTGASATAK